MALGPLPPPPKGNFLEWALKHPDHLEAYFERLVQLSKLEVFVKTAGGTIRVPVEFSKENATVEIPAPQGAGSGTGGGGAGAPFGDVFGPSSANADNLAAFADSTGKTLRDAGASLGDIDPRGLHSLWIPAAVISPSAVNGCSPLATHAIESIVDGGDAEDEFTDVIDGGGAADEFADILDGNPI
jgi:hypothetical protein